MGDPIQDIPKCYKSDQKWPSPAEAGLPNVCAGIKAGVQAGCSFYTPFIPPNPLIPAPPIPLPLIQAAFMAPIVQGSAPTAPLFALACIQTIWLTFLLLDVSLIALSPLVPPVPVVIGLFQVSCASVGLVMVSGPPDCIPKSIVQMMHDTLGI